MKKYAKTIGLLAGLILLIAAAGAAYAVLKDRVQAPSALDGVGQSADAEKTDSGEDGGGEETDSTGEDVETEQEAEEESAGDSSTQRQQAVDFTVFDSQGQEVKLSDFFGKPVVVNFWATWCGYCKQEMPDFQKAYEEYKDQVHFLMIQSTDGSRETKEMGEAYIQEEGYTFPVYYDENREAVYIYSVYSLPTTILLDAQGRVAAYNPGLVEKEPLTAALEQLLKEQSGE